MTVAELIARLALARGDLEVFVVSDGKLKPLDPEFCGRCSDRFELDCDPPLTDEEENDD